MELFYTDNELFKVEDFKGLNYSKTNFDICDKLEDKDWKQFLDDNQEFRNLLIKLGFFIFGDDYYIEDDMFCDFQILGDLSKDLDKIYINIDSQGSVCLVDDLNKFSEDYRTEEDWGIDFWNEFK
jgi:hypothetical protein